jgi:hypothetical protein
VPHAGRCIRRARNDRAMLLVTVMCSDPHCVEEREIVVDDLQAVETHVCDCGYGFAVVSVSELAETPRSGSLVSLPARHRPPTRRAA